MAKDCQTLTIQLLGLGKIGANHSMVTHATGEIKTPLFEVHKIVFANATKDHTIITDFEGQLYSDEMRYLVPKVYYNGLCADNVSVDLFFKIFKPSGELKVGKISPQNYTGKVTHTMRPGKHAFRMMGWGRENGGAYPAGKYKYELWGEGKLLFSTCLEIKSR